MNHVFKRWLGPSLSNAKKKDKKLRSNRWEARKVLVSMDVKDEKGEGHMAAPPKKVGKKVCQTSKICEEEKPGILYVI